jgi:hypothetical protein
MVFTGDVLIGWNRQAISFPTIGNTNACALIGKGTSAHKASAESEERSPMCSAAICRVRLSKTSQIQRLFSRRPTNDQISSASKQKISILAADDATICKSARCQLELFDKVYQPGQRDFQNPADAAQRKAFEQQTFNQFPLIRRNGFISDDKLPRTINIDSFVCRNKYDRYV